MSNQSDWLPGTRVTQLEMARNWQDVAGTSGSAWGIPPAVMQNFDVLAQAADNALETARNESTRTPVATAQCGEAFGALIDAMRDLKRRYFLVPPLLDSDLISLGLKPHDKHPTPSSTPTAQVTIETFLVGRHELGVRIIYLTGSPDDKANKGYRIWYSVVAPGETPPTSPKQLTNSFYTKRRKDLIEFEYEDSGKMVYFAVQVENDGKKGPWGPLVKALIP
jgi:hypothetical protein